MLEKDPPGTAHAHFSHFAPAGRADPEHLRQMADRALADPVLQMVLQAVGGYVMILDGHRQIIAANSALLEFLGAQRFDSVLGLRPGEAAGCVNARRGPDGCGTSVQCRHCGAVAAILAAQVKDEPVNGECSLACCNDSVPRPTDFEVRVSPLTLGQERVYAFVFHDTTAAKRRELLEQMFLHDLGNLATGLIGWSDELASEDTSEAATQIIDLAERLKEQLAEQRLLVEFEQGTAKLAYTRIDFDVLVAHLRAWFGAHDCAKQRHFVIECDPLPQDFETDQQLLLRILGNLVKNAFEATPRGGTVTLRLFARAERVVFEVHNAGAIPNDSQCKLFKQRFSTKGPARGLGTHAIQFFGEQCLGGQISFVSREPEGTVFRFELASGVH